MDLRKKRVTLVARDIAPSRSLEEAGKELEGLGIDCQRFLGSGKPFNPTVSNGIGSAVEGADFVLSAMSTTEKLSKEEMEAVGLAQKMGKPYGFFSDEHGIYRHEWFAPFRHDASLVLLHHESNVKGAAEIFSRAMIVVTGNPVREEEFYPKIPREAVRRIFKVEDDEVFVLVPGCKEYDLNLLHFVGVVAATLRDELREKTMKVFVSPHPGEDETVWPIYRSCLGLVKGCMVRFVAPGEMAGINMLAGADVVVDIGGGVGMTAVNRHMPVVMYLTNVAQRFYSSRVETSRILKDKGFAKFVDDDDQHSLALAINRVLTIEHFSSMRAAMEKEIPTPAAPGTAAKRMATAVAAILMEE